MESLDAEFSGSAFHRLCESRHFPGEDCPEGFTWGQHGEFIQQIFGKDFSESQLNLIRMRYKQQTTRKLADIKAEEAKAAREPLTPVELFVGHATETNFNLFLKAFKEAANSTRAVFNEKWLPDDVTPQRAMELLDYAKNFMRLADTYFMAIATPIMQAASVARAQEAVAEIMAPREASAEERALSGYALVGEQVVINATCSADTRHGFRATILQFDSTDSEYELTFNDNTMPSWHPRHCFDLTED